MKLSLYILNDWMFDKILSSKIDKGDCVIAHCLLSDLDDGRAPDCLYISKAGFHAGTGADGNSVICRSGEEYLAINSDSEVEVYQEIMDAFIFYNHWENELKDAVIMRSSFQRITEIAYTAFRSNILAFDWRGVVLGSMPKEADNTVGAVLEPFIFKRIQEGAVCKKVAQNTIPAGFVDTAVFASVLACNVFFPDNSFVIFYISSDVSGKNEAHMQLAMYMRSVISYLKPSCSEDGNLEPLHSELIQILDGKSPDFRKIEEIQKFKDWRPGEKYLLYVFEAHSTFTLQRKGANWMLADKINHSIVFTYKERSLMLLPFCECNVAEQILPNILPYLDISGGVSLPFSAWDDLATAFIQAETTRELGGNRPGELYHCEDYAWEYIVFSIQEKCVNMNLISPDALLLKEYDDKNGTEFLKTLNVFLKSQSNLTASAEELFIHLNSMKYRIKKIEAMISSDLKKHSDRMVLLFSSDILLGYH